jgi:hypothetical protein
MVSPALDQSPSNRYLPAAGPIHTIFVLAVLGGWTFYGKSLADHLNSAANPNRVRFYLLTLFFEWLLFVLVVAGVRASGVPIRIVLGDQWHSVRESAPGYRNRCGVLDSFRRHPFCLGLAAARRRPGS